MEVGDGCGTQCTHTQRSEDMCWIGIDLSVDLVEDGGIALDHFGWDVFVAFP